ncbi:MAG: JAB domain-containing protein [Sphingopyxis sp.]
MPRLLLRPCFPVDGEILLIAGFDAFDRLLCLERAESDRAGRCIVPPPVWRAALDAKPAQIVMAHNHPSGIARPSDADLAATRESARFLALLGVTLSDHMIFTADGHFSFWRAGLL